MYSAYDSLAACWKHENGALGAGNWNFGSSYNEDKVEILGSGGKIEFSVIDHNPIRLIKKDGAVTEL